jgi:hypothetical protein
MLVAGAPEKARGQCRVPSMSKARPAGIVSRLAPSREATRARPWSRTVAQYCEGGQGYQQSSQSIIEKGGHQRVE